MRIRFLEAAQAELDDAIEYYDYEVQGLGRVFLQEVLQALQRIDDFPDAWPPCSSKTRRCMVRRFPYAVIYQVRTSEILIVAVANLHRKPDYWVDRVSGVKSPTK